MLIKHGPLYQILLLVSIPLIISQCVYDSKTIDTKKIIRKCQKAVVEIDFVVRKYDEKLRELLDTVAVASGFLISKDGYLLTAKHVIEKTKEHKAIMEIRVKTSDGRSLKASVPRPYPPQIGLDIGILKINDVSVLSYLQIEVDRLELGEEVAVLGYPEEKEKRGITVTRGIINNIFYTREEFRISAQGSKGSSGSPVLNSEGKVIGIQTATPDPIRDDKWVGLFHRAANVVMHRKEILDFIEQHRDKYKK